MERHRLDLWPDTDHNQPPRPYWITTAPEAWPGNPAIDEPETYGMAPQQIIKRLTHEYEKSLAENCRLVKELDRLRQAWVFRHFEFALAVGIPVAVVVVIWLIWPGL